MSHRVRGQIAPIAIAAAVAVVAWPDGMLAYSLMAATLALATTGAEAKDRVKVGFIGPLTGGVSANGIGGRNSADLAVRLRNGDASAKYEYEMVVLDDECKPDVAVQVATKMAADKDIIAAATHYCLVTAIATVDTYHKFGFPVIVWGAVLPDITYRNKYDEVHRVNGTMINQNDANAELICRLPHGIGVTRLTDLPLEWSRQHEMLGLPAQ